MPIRLTLSEKSIAGGGAEYKLRKEAGKGDVMSFDAAIERAQRDAFA